MAVDEGEVIFAICSRGHGPSSIWEEESQELKVEAYRVLTSHLKQSGSKFLPQLLDRFQEIIPLTLNDAGAASEELALAALQFLGYCLFDQSLADISQAEVIVPVLCELALQQQSSSEVIKRLLWCLANHKMNCSASLLTAHVKVQVLMISQLIMSHKHSTVTVEAECLNILQRMYEDHEAVFVMLDPTMWYPSLVTMLTGEHKQNITAAYELAKELESLLVGNHDVACSLVESLKEKLACTLHKQFTNMKIEQTTLLIWQHFVRVLDRQIHNYGNWFNSFLKTAEQAFRHTDSKVQVAAYKAWRSLIDNYALNLRILTGSRRMKLITTPLVGFPAHARHEVVDVERFITWQYLIGSLNNKRTQCVKQVITPLLLFSVGIDSRLSSIVMDEWALDGAYLCVTPTTLTSLSGTENMTNVSINIVHHHGDDISVISSPRIHPGIVYHSVLSSCCQLVMSLCGYPPGSQITGAVVPVIKCGDGKSIFMKQPRTFLLFMEAILQLSPIVNDDVCRGVWQAVFCSVTTALTDPGILTVSPLVLPLMSILRIALKTKKLQQLTVLMVTELCYLYHQIPFKLSSEDMLVVSSLSDKKMFPWQFLLETILHYPIILQKIQMVTVVTVLKFSFANGKILISNMSSIVNMLIQSMPSNKEHRWLLFEVWHNLISTMTDKIVKVGKLYEDNSAEYNMSLPCQLLIYPIKLLYTNVTVAKSVPIEVRAKLIPTWTKLMETVAMVTTSESTNDLVTMVLDKLVEFLQEQEAEIYMLCALTRICLSSVVHANFAKGDPCGVVNAQLKLLQWILLKTSQSKELLQEAMTTSLFMGLTDLIIKIFTMLKGTELVVAGLNHVIPHLTNFFSCLHNQFDGDYSTLYTSLRKVWSAIATCLQARYTGSYSSELLVVLSPLLVLMLSLRDRGRHNNSLCSQMLTFWCATFAKEATLVYPEELCDALRQFRHMGGLIELPGWPEDDKNVTVVANSFNGDIEENSVQLTEPQSNCLHKAVPNLDSLQSKGKKYLRARRKLPLDCYNSENMEGSPVIKKKRLSSYRYQKDHCREKQRSCDAPKGLDQLSSESSNHSNHCTEDLSIDEMSQSDESPTIPVPIVIACEINDDDSEGVDVTDDINSPSLLFDSNTPISVLPVTKTQLSNSNSQEISMATEQDSVSTIPDTAETSRDDGCVVTMVTNCDSDVINERVSVADDVMGVIPNSNDVTTVYPVGDSSSSSVCSHLLDHSYTTLQDGVGGASSYETLKCLEKMATMITPVPRKSAVLLKDNGCHAARCSAIKRSNRTLARVRRHQQQISLSPKKSQVNKIMEDRMISSKHTSLPVERVPSFSDVRVGTGMAAPSAASDGDDSVTDMVDSEMQSVDFVAKVMHNVEHPEESVTNTGAVTKPMVTVTQPAVTVTQPVVTVTQPAVTVTQPAVTVTQPAVTVTKPVVTVTQPAVTVTQPTVTVTKPAVTVTQPAVTVTQPAVTVTQPAVTVTQPTVTVTKPVVTVIQPAVTGTKPVVTVTQPAVTVTKPVITVTQPAVTVAQPAVMVTKPVVTVTQPAVTVTQPAITVTQPVVTITQRDEQQLLEGTHDHSTVNCSQGGRTSCSLAHSNVAMVAKPGITMTHQEDIMTQSMDMVTHRTDTVTQSVDTTHKAVTQPLPSTSSNTTGVSSPPQVVKDCTKLNNIATLPPVFQPSLPLQQYNDLVKQLAITTISTATLHGIHGNNHLPCVSNQSLKGSSIVAMDTTSKMACLYDMLSSCLVSSDMTIPVTPHHSVSTSAMPHHFASSSSQLLPIIHNVFSNVNTNQLPFSNPAIIRHRQPNVFTATPTVKAQVIPNTKTPTPTTCTLISLTSVKSPSVTSLAKVNSASFQPIQIAKSSNINVSTSINSSVTPANVTSVMSVTSDALQLVNSPSVTSLTSVNSASLTSINSNVTPLISVNSPSVTPLTSINSSVTSLTSVNSLSVTPLISVNSPSVTSLTSVNSPSVTPLTSVNSPSVTPLTSVNSLSVTPLTSVNSPSVTPLTSVNSPSVTPLISVNSPSVTPLTSVNSSVTSLTSVNSPSVTSLISVNSPSVTPLTSVNSSVTSLTSVNSLSVTSLTSVNSPSVSSISAYVTNNASNKCLPVILKQTEDVEMLPTSSTGNSVTIETVSQATVSENKPCKQSGDNIESPPHTPTGGILKRVSQFDTPTTSGKRRRVSFADTVDDNCSDIYSDRRYVTSPRSKLHSKVSPRRLLPKPDKTNNTGKTKSSALSSNVDNNPLPTYPALSSCVAPVDSILPDLISSPMARSLGKLFHAREIRTVGHLASLPENQVKSLPIQQPKLKTLRDTLESFEKHLEQTSSKVTNGDKSLSSSREQSLRSEVPTVMELSSSDHVITTSSHDPCILTEHVSSDDVTITNTSAKQTSLGKTVDQPAIPPETDNTNLSSSCAITSDTNSITTSAADNVDQPLDMPTSGNGPLQPISDRMQYLTESCSYDNSIDSLILATPESQCVIQVEQVGLLATTNNNTATTCFNEDPLMGPTDKDDNYQTPTDEGNSLNDDVIPVNSTIPQSRTALHNHLQTIAARKFPELLTKLNSFIKFIEDCHLDDGNLELATSIIIDALDYNVLASKSP